MTFDAAAFKRRRAIMVGANVLAALGALIGALGYFQFAQDWALAVFVGALVVGFGAQIWFIAGLRGPRKGV
ncbi:MAG: hypothetical protein JF588_13495 [Caulobacterales bacterium]|nr:hypothetical protein [Caulobacterales bacterium]